MLQLIQAFIEWDFWKFLGMQFLFWGAMFIIFKICFLIGGISFDDDEVDLEEKNVVETEEKNVVETHKKNKIEKSEIRIILALVFLNVVFFTLLFIFYIRSGEIVCLLTGYSGVALSYFLCQLSFYRRGMYTCFANACLFDLFTISIFMVLNLYFVGNFQNSNYMPNYSYLLTLFIIGTIKSFVANYISKKYEKNTNCDLENGK